MKTKLFISCLVLLMLVTGCSKMKSTVESLAISAKQAVDSAQGGVVLCRRSRCRGEFGHDCAEPCQGGGFDD